MTLPITFDECLLLSGTVVTGLLFLMTLSRPG
jgi:hypothetical protein